MRVFRGKSFKSGEVPASVLAIGNFDGVHRGHQAVMQMTTDVALERGVSPGLLCFEPHPRTFFSPHNPVFRITSLEFKAKLLSALGLDFMAVLEFDQELASLPPDAFVETFLVSQLSAVHVVTGADFRFGKARGGDVAMLRELGDHHGFSVSAVTPQGDEAEGFQNFSSTSVRQALLHGNPKAAATILGYWWTVMGEVVTGDQIGHSLGFPTVNLKMEEESAPRLGSYAVRVRLVDGDREQVWQGAGYVGRRPTFDKEDVVLEVFLMDFSGDLYGRTLMVEFIEFIRGDEKFASVEDLTAHMERDCSDARTILDQLERDGDPISAYPLGALQARGGL